MLTVWLGVWGHFKSHFCDHLALFEEISLPRYATSVLDWLTQVQNIIILWESMPDFIHVIILLKSIPDFIFIYREGASDCKARGSV